MKRITCDRMDRHETSRAGAWLKLIAGACLLLLVVAALGSGYTPPGVFGEVVRHNMRSDIDASPFFYGDVENMSALVEGAEHWWQNRKDTPNDDIDVAAENTDQEVQP